MKKKLVLLLVTSFLIMGCSNNADTNNENQVSQKEYDSVVKERDDYKKKYETLLNSINNENENKSETAEKLVDKNLETSDADLIQQIEVTNEYNWTSSGYHYVGLELKNNSEYTTRLDIEFLFYDASNNLIGTKKETEVAFGSNDSTLIYKANETEFDHYEYNIVPSLDKSFLPAVPNLSNVVSDSDGKLIYSITNNGEAPAQYVECLVLFFRNSEVVGFNKAFAVDSKHEIAPGSTEHAEVNKPYNTPYDDYKLFLKGRTQI